MGIRVQGNTEKEKYKYTFDMTLIKKIKSNIQFEINQIIKFIRQSFLDLYK